MFINPVITHRKGMVEQEEGCLSFPEIYAPVRRPETDHRSRPTTWPGRKSPTSWTGSSPGRPSTSIDHLDGVLFIDRLSDANRLKVKEALGDLVREFEGDRQRGLIPGDEHMAARLAELEQLRT